MRLKIISAEKELLSEDVSKVTLPGESGEMTILKGHAKLVSILKKGVVRHSSGERSIPGGVVSVENDQVTIIL